MSIADSIPISYYLERPARPPRPSVSRQIVEALAWERWPGTPPPDPSVPADPDAYLAALTAGNRRRGAQLRAKTIAQAEQIAAMRAEGLAPAEVARRMGMTVHQTGQCVCRARRYGVVIPPGKPGKRKAER